MNNTVKIILGLVAGAVVLCLCAGAAGLLLFRATSSTVRQVIDTDVNVVAETSGAIAEYSLPDGYGEGYSTQVAGFSMVSYMGEDGHSHIYFFQLPAGIHVDQAEIERRLRDSAPKTDDRWVDRMEVVEQKPATIRGQEVTLVVSEGVDHDNQPYRQVSGMFQGEGGQALVVVSGPVATWDQAVVDDFLASIH